MKEIERINKREEAAGMERRERSEEGKDGKEVRGMESRERNKEGE